MNIIKLLLSICLFIFLSSTNSLAKVVDYDKAQEIEDLLSWTIPQKHGGVGDNRCIYVIYSSECSRCQNLVKHIKKIDKNIEIRWLLNKAFKGNSFLVSHAMPQSMLDYMYGKKLADNNEDVLVLLHNILVVNAIWIKANIGRIMYPLLIYKTKNGIEILETYDINKIKKITSTIVSMKENVLDSSMLKDLEKKFKWYEKTRYVNTSSLSKPIHVYPSTESPIMGELPPNHYYNKSVWLLKGENNERWAAFCPYPAIHSWGYVELDEDEKF